MYCVALTGGIASGKSLAAEFFAARGAAIYDSDDIAREISTPGGVAIPAIRQRLGDWAIDDNGGLHRVLVRQRVFADADLRLLLESVLHPLIRSEMLRRLAANDSAPYALAVIPLYFETNTFSDFIRRVLVVDCPQEIQIKRSEQRDGLTKKEILMILAAQADRNKRLAGADDVINNDDDKIHLESEVDKLHRIYVEESKKGEQYDKTDKMRHS